MLIGILMAGHMPDRIARASGDYDRLYARLLEGQGFEFRAWPVVDMEFPQTPRDADGWLISGSRHGSYEDLPFIAPLETFIRDAHAARVPMVGICFGHQIIAQALGGKVEKFDGGWGLGRHEYDWEGRRVASNAVHQDQVTEIPDGARRIAQSDFCRNAALAYGDHVLTMQPHPEFGREEMRLLLEDRLRGVAPDDRIAEAMAQIDLPDDAAFLGERIGAFYRAAARG